MSSVQEEKIHCNYPNSQLSPEEWDRIEACMYPEKKSQSGFLVLGETINDVLTKDLEYLKSVGITCEQIGDRLKTVLGKYARTRKLEYENKSKDEDYDYDKPTIVEGNLSITSVTYMGAQQCPFQNYGIDGRYHGYSYGDSDIVITNTDTGEKIEFNTLLPHMIKQHSFFEGSVSHRLEPEKVIRVLNIQPGVDYSPVFKSYKAWSPNGSRGWLENFNPEYTSALEYYCCDHAIIQTNERRFFTEDNREVVSYDHRIYAYLFPANINDYIGEKEILLDSHRQCLSYREYRRRIFLHTNERHIEYNKKPIGRTMSGKPSYQHIYTPEEIEEKITEEENRIENYKQNHDIENMFAQLFIMEGLKNNSHQVDNLEVFGVKVSHAFTGEASYYGRTYKYIEP